MEDVSTSLPPEPVSEPVTPPPSPEPEFVADAPVAAAAPPVDASGSESEAASDAAVYVAYADSSYDAGDGGAVFYDEPIDLNGPEQWALPTGAGVREAIRRIELSDTLGRITMLPDPTAAGEVEYGADSPPLSEAEMAMLTSPVLNARLEAYDPDRAVQQSADKASVWENFAAGFKDAQADNWALKAFVGMAPSLGLGDTINAQTLATIQNDVAVDAYAKNVDTYSNAFKIGQGALDITQKITGGVAVISGAMLALPAGAMAVVTAFFSKPVVIATGTGLGLGNTVVGIAKEDTRQVTNGVFDMATSGAVGRLLNTPFVQTALANSAVLKAIRTMPADELASTVLNHADDLGSWPQHVLQKLQTVLTAATGVQSGAPGLVRADDNTVRALALVDEALAMQAPPSTGGVPNITPDVELVTPTSGTASGLAPNAMQTAPAPTNGMRDATQTAEVALKSNGAITTAQDGAIQSGVFRSNAAPGPHLSIVQTPHSMSQWTQTLTSQTNHTAVAAGNYGISSKNPNADITSVGNVPSVNAMMGDEVLSGLFRNAQIIEGTDLMSAKFGQTGTEAIFTQEFQRDYLLDNKYLMMDIKEGMNRAYKAYLETYEPQQISFSAASGNHIIAEYLGSQSENIAIKISINNGESLVVKTTKDVAETYVIPLEKIKAIHILQKDPIIQKFSEIGYKDEDILFALSEKGHHPNREVLNDLIIMPFVKGEQESFQDISLNVPEQLRQDLIAAVESKGAYNEDLQMELEDLNEVNALLIAYKNAILKENGFDLVVDYWADNVIVQTGDDGSPRYINIDPFSFTEDYTNAMLELKDLGISVFEYNRTKVGQDSSWWDWDFLSGERDQWLSSGNTDALPNIQMSGSYDMNSINPHQDITSVGPESISSQFSQEDPKAIDLGWIASIYGQVKTALLPTIQSVVSSPTLYLEMLKANIPQRYEMLRNRQLSQQFMQLAEQNIGIDEALNPPSATGISISTEATEALKAIAGIGPDDFDFAYQTQMMRNPQGSSSSLTVRSVIRNQENSIVAHGNDGISSANESFQAHDASHGSVYQPVSLTYGESVVSSHASEIMNAGLNKALSLWEMKNGVAYASGPVTEWQKFNILSDESDRNLNAFQTTFPDKTDVAQNIFSQFLDANPELAQTLSNNRIQAFDFVTQFIQTPANTPIPPLNLRLNEGDTRKILEANIVALEELGRNNIGDYSSDIEVLQSIIDAGKPEQTDGAGPNNNITMSGKPYPITSQTKNTGFSGVAPIINSISQVPSIDWTAKVPDIKAMMSGDYTSNLSSRTLEEVEAFLPTVNPLNRDNNCSLCAVTLDLFISGKGEQSALQYPQTKSELFNIAEAYNADNQDTSEWTRHYKNVRGIQDIIDFYGNSDNGSHGIIAVVFKNDGEHSNNSGIHFLNIAKLDGNVTLFDSQANLSATIEDGQSPLALLGQVLYNQLYVIRDYSLGEHAENPNSSIAQSIFYQDALSSIDYIILINTTGRQYNPPIGLDIFSPIAKQLDNFTRADFLSVNSNSIADLLKAAPNGRIGLNDEIINYQIIGEGEQTQTFLLSQNDGEIVVKVRKENSLWKIDPELHQSMIDSINRDETIQNFLQENDIIIPELQYADSNILVQAYEPKSSNITEEQYRLIRDELKPLVDAKLREQGQWLYAFDMEGSDNFYINQKGQIVIVDPIVNLEGSLFNAGAR